MKSEEVTPHALLLTRHTEFLGGYAEGVTPVPIPNTEVKPLWADDTARVAVWESRSPPGINEKGPASRNGSGAFFCTTRGKNKTDGNVYSSYSLTKVS